MFFLKKRSCFFALCILTLSERGPCRSCEATSFPFIVSKKTLTCCATLLVLHDFFPSLTLPWSSLSISCRSARQWSATSKGLHEGFDSSHQRKKEKEIIHTHFSFNSIWTAHHLSVHSRQRLYFERVKKRSISSAWCTKCTEYRYSDTWKKANCPRPVTSQVLRPVVWKYYLDNMFSTNIQTDKGYSHHRLTTGSCTERVHCTCTHTHTHCATGQK